jgi:streptogramin lyase
MKKSRVLALQVRKKLLSVVVPVALLASLVGISPTSADSTILGTTGREPVGITIDSAGNIYTANSSSSNVSKITPAGVSSILGTTTGGGVPFGITIDSSGNVYTSGGPAHNVSKITPAGNSSTLGNTGYSPYGITIDSSGNIYTANGNANTVSKITPAGVSSILGTTGSNPYGITIDSSGNIYTANRMSSNVSKITPAGVSSILGTTGSGPHGITIDSSGNIYTANGWANTVSKITPAGNSSILGTTGSNPYGITIDRTGNIYTANYGSNNVSKITTPASAEELAAAKAAEELAAQRIAEAKREAEKLAARAEITNSLKTSKDVNLEMFTKAEISGVTEANIAAVQAEIAALPQTSRADLSQVLKIARKYEVVGKIALDQFASVYSDDLIEIDLIPQGSKHKAALTAAIKKLPPSDRSTYTSIKKAIDAEMAEIQARKDRLANVISRNTSRYSK